MNVVNKKVFRGSGEYIGRPSVLGNPFAIGRDGNREQVIAKYRVWLWAEIKKRGKVYDELVRLMQLSEAGDVTLVCFCKPLPCHGDIIVKAIEWLRSSTQPMRVEPNWAEFDTLPNEEKAKLEWVRKNFEDVNPYLEDEIRDDPGCVFSNEVASMQAEWPATQKRLAERDRQQRKPKCAECRTCSILTNCARFKDKPCSMYKRA